MDLQPRARKKRTKDKEPSPPTHSKRGRRADCHKSSRRNGSASASARDGAAQGSPDAPAARARGAPPAQNVAAPARVSVAHTPDIPPRFEGLLKAITSLVPCEIKGKSYECTLSRMTTFLKWTGSEMALFFEWSDDEEKVTCWMHDILKGKHFKFTVNAAFSHEMDNLNVERAAVVFSTNFSGDDDYWSCLKDMLLKMFGSFKGEGLREYDYLYVFTRVGDSVYFRNFKIMSLPTAGNPSSGFVFTKVNTMFCLKLVNDQGASNLSTTCPYLSKNQTPTTLTLCPVTIYSNSNGHAGFCLSHNVDFNGITYSVFLENGSYVSSLEKLEGFNTSLAEIVVKKPLLKIKHIIGSVTNKEYCFARQRCKSILQSLFAEFAMLLESGKCISGTIKMHNVLVSGTKVKLYGLDVTDYNEDVAKKSVSGLVNMVRSCFPDDGIPIDLEELLEDLVKDPLNVIQTAKNDCSLLKAANRRTLLINIYSEYITNVEAKSSGFDQINDEPNQINEFTFFNGCPYAEDWKLIMKDNEYMMQVCNVEESSNEDTYSGNEQANASVIKRMRKKEKMSKNTGRFRRTTKKKKLEANKGKLQFSSMRNFAMRMPAMARKDGILPFRLGMADHILTAYFPRFLRFVEKRMRAVKAQREKIKKTALPSSWLGLGSQSH